MHPLLKFAVIVSLFVTGMGFAAAQRPDPCETFYDPLTGNQPTTCHRAIPQGSTVRTGNFITTAISVGNIPLPPEQFAWTLPITCPPDVQIGGQIRLPGSDTLTALSSGQTITATTGQFPAVCLHNTGAAITLTSPDGQPQQARILPLEGDNQTLLVTLPPSAILTPGLWTLQVSDFQLLVEIPETVPPALRLIWNAENEVDEAWIIGFQPEERIIVDTLSPRLITETQVNERGMLVVRGQIPYVIAGEHSGSIRFMRNEDEIDTSAQEFTEAEQVPLGHLGYLMPTNGPGPFLLNAPYPDMLPNMIWGIPVDLPSCSSHLPSRLVVGEAARVVSGMDLQTLYRTAGNRITDFTHAVSGEVFIPIYGPLCFDEVAWWLVEVRGLALWIIEGEDDTYYLEPV